MRKSGEGTGNVHNAVKRCGCSMSLLSYEYKFSNLKLNTQGGGEKSPHKVAMLLAVIELVENGTLADNCIYFDQSLKTVFTRHFEVLAGPKDRNNPHLPFFHLRSSGFWFHHVKPGKSSDYSALSTATGPDVIESHIAFAYLSDDLFELLSHGVARELLKSSLHKNLTSHDRGVLLDVGKGWDWLECEAVVQDYFIMLRKELCGDRYSKAEHRRNLLPKLNGRSEGSVEFKHQNISAVLIEMGQPYIQGYKPAFNYQQQLRAVVMAYLAGHPIAIDDMSGIADAPVPDMEDKVDWSGVYDPELPERIATVQESQPQYLARKINFSERERSNRQLGERGEAFVVEFERYRLQHAGRSDLAKEVEWSSNARGDGLGYDVRSFDPSLDTELFIEVKTTNSGKYQPFYISGNELLFSQQYSDQYSLYRVYDFRKNARIFRLSGAVDQYVNLAPSSYKASF